jgi:hypothetical protein
MTLYLSTFSMIWWMTFNEHVVKSPVYFSFIILSLTVTLFSGSSFVSVRWYYFPTRACVLYLFSVIQFCVFVNIFPHVFEILRLLINFTTF